MSLPDKITEHIYLGKANSAQNLETLQSIGITHILMVGYDLTAYFPKNIIYEHIELDDKENSAIDKFFFYAAQYINQVISNNGKILVHCQAGVSRSASIVIAYLMISQKISYNEAFLLCKKGRPCINPNKGFVNKLKQLESITMHSCPSAWSTVD
jgi:protein-tyrosine phosphatase